ncbi:MAG: hypothetical protein R2856_12500 [Caldilineaceae bacterium]
MICAGGSTSPATTIGRPLPRTAPKRLCRSTADKLYGGDRRPANGLSAAQIPHTLAAPSNPQQSTQQAFGSIMLALT